MGSEVVDCGGAVARAKARKETNMMPRLGIDEKVFLKSQNYITLLNDLDNSTVEAISDGIDISSGIQRLPRRTPRPSMCGMC
jgi:hypothetical protein